MASITATKRLTREYKNLKADPLDLVYTKPSEANILDWHYIITGPPDTPFTGGEYHGLLRFPTDYPFKPPSIIMITPNGKFKPNTRLCLSISDYHPEMWNPAWSVSTILTGLMSFMTSNEIATGCVKATDEKKRYYARTSEKFNRCNVVFMTQFEDYVKKKAERDEVEARVRARAEREKLKLAKDEAIKSKKAETKRISQDLSTLVDSPDSFDFNEVEDLDEDSEDENGVVLLDETSDESDKEVKDQKHEDTEPIVLGENEDRLSLGEKKQKLNPDIVID